MYQLQIVSHDETDIHDVGKPRESLRRVERTEEGANINLDHERYHTRIVEVDA